MAAVNPRSRKTWLLGCCVVASAILSCWFFFQNRSQVGNAELPPGRNVLVTGVADGRVNEQLLRSITWADVGPTAESLGANKGLRDEVSAVAGKLGHSPALYLRALLQLVANDPQGSLTTFLLIPNEEIPPTHLYAPYRLHTELRPSQPNPFQAALVKAVDEDKVPPLVQARVMAREGRLQESLKAYLRTDPAAWADLDLRTLRGLRIHASSANDTAVLLQAALRGGRVPINLRTQVIEIVKAPQDKTTLEDLKRQLLVQMEANPDLRSAAITAAKQQLTVRQQFAGRKYRELLEQHEARTRTDLADQTVLMLSLSAARLQDVPAFDLWSQELKRRYPTTEIEQWLHQLRPTPQSRGQ